MLNASLPGDQQFRKGIIEYLTQFSGSNTDTDDLWNSLTQVVCVCVCYLLTLHMHQQLIALTTFNIELPITICQAAICTALICSFII